VSIRGLSHSKQSLLQHLVRGTSGRGNDYARKEKNIFRKQFGTIIYLICCSDHGIDKIVEFIDFYVLSLIQFYYIYVNIIVLKDGIFIGI